MKSSVRILGLAAIASALAAIGIAHAAPDITAPRPEALLADSTRGVMIASPATGHFVPDTKVAGLAEQTVDAFRHVTPPSFLDAYGRVRADVQPHSTLAEVSQTYRGETLDLKLLNRMMPNPRRAMASAARARDERESSCQSLDSRLDARKLPAGREQALLRQQDCG